MKIVNCGGQQNFHGDGFGGDSANFTATDSTSARQFTAADSTSAPQTSRRRIQRRLRKLHGDGLNGGSAN
ncbi:MAG: hypothetical protein IKD80_05105, partial [Selenomonadaceae bacterium]|nr:hypothetical protein [Selenomonadaceae bacterium]